MISTVGVPAGGGESVPSVVGGVVPAGTALSVAPAVAGAVAVDVGSAATGGVVAVGCDTACEQATSSKVANAARKSQRSKIPSEWTVLPACYERDGPVGLRMRGAMGLKGPLQPLRAIVETPSLITGEVQLALETRWVRPSHLRGGVVRRPWGGDHDSAAGTAIST